MKHWADHRIIGFFWLREPGSASFSSMIFPAIALKKRQLWMPKPIWRCYPWGPVMAFLWYVSQPWVSPRGKISWIFQLSKLRSSTCFLSNFWCLSGANKWYSRTSSGWWFGTFFIFPYIGNNDPNWRTHIFQRGRSTTNQSWISLNHIQWNIFDGSLLKCQMPELLGESSENGSKPWRVFFIFFSWNMSYKLTFVFLGAGHLRSVMNH